MLRGVTHRLQQLAARFALGQQTDFAAIKQSHLQWRTRLIEMLEGRQHLAASDLTDHHRCPFGQWCDHPDQAALRAWPAFQEVAAQHQAFHALVAQIAHAWQGGQAAAAHRHFAQLNPQTVRLFGLLDALALQAARATVPDPPATAGPRPAPAHP